MSATEQNLDITAKVAPYLDVHMVSPILDYLRELSLYDPKKVTLEKIRVVERTNMLELVEMEYERYPDDAAMQAEYIAKKPALAERKTAIFAVLDHEPELVKKVSAFFQNVELVAQLRAASTFTLEFVGAQHGITVEALQTYYAFAKTKYECGMYIEAEEMLANVLSLSSPAASSSAAASLSSSQAQSLAACHQGALWGKLACRILQAKWEDSVNDLQAVKESIEVRNVPPSDQLRQRAWLMHWSLFVYLNQKDGMEALVDLFSERYYLQCIENLCPWLLRYYTVAMILSPVKRKTALKDVLQEISSLSYLYSDAFTQFLDSLFDAFDFDSAQAKLQECAQLLKNDFFLQAHADKFLHEARMLITEMYCTVHHSVDLTMLASKLNLSDEDAEKWMVDMVRNSSAGSCALNAKIDSFNKQVLIAPPQRLAHKQVVEATKELTSRTGVLNHNLETLAKDQSYYIFRR